MSTKVKTPPIHAIGGLHKMSDGVLSKYLDATVKGLTEAQESLLAAEGSDWCWWFGPEHSTANDAEFDALYRKHLTGVYLA